jgi:DNA-binding CsgD family transcriptional regulator
MDDRYPLSFLREISRSSSNAPLSDELAQRIADFTSSFAMLDKGPSFFYLFDFVHMRYLYVSESITDLMGGYTAVDWIQNGPDWVLSLVYPEDVCRLKKLHKALFDFYYTLPREERKEYKYIWEFRLTRKDGQVIWLMQQGAFIEIDADGRPMVTFDTISDTTHFKKDNSMTLTMFKRPESPRLKLYFPIYGDQSFTKREVELIRLLSEGLSSKEIAERLFISSHTVDTHRRNILKKSGFKDSNKMIVYARENGLI